MRFRGALFPDAQAGESLAPMIRWKDKGHPMSNYVTNSAEISTETSFAIGKLTINRDDAESFLSALDPAATEFTFQTFDDNVKRKDKQLTRILHGTLERCWDQLTNLSRRGAGIFVTVNETDGEGRNASNVKRVRALFIDLDGTPLPAEDAFHVKPHIVIESSPGKWHCYWLVTNCTLDQFNALQRRLIRNYDSDKSVHDLPRVMRLLPSVTRVAEAHDHEPYAVEQVTEGLLEVDETKPRGDSAGGGAATPIRTGSSSIAARSRSPAHQIGPSPKTRSCAQRWLRSPPTRASSPRSSATVAWCGSTSAALFTGAAGTSAAKRYGATGRAGAPSSTRRD